MCDYTGLWSRTNKLHLRDFKYIQLKNSNSLFLAVSPTTKYIESHRFYGNKPAYELSIPPDKIYELTTRVIIKIIEKTINNKYKRE